MKILSLKISFIVLICLTQTVLSHKCIEFPNPFSRYEIKMVDCPKNSSSSTLDKRASSSSDMFTVNFKCQVNNKTLCNQVQNVFNTAGKFITATLNLKTSISVDAQFLNLCEQEGGCSANSIILGAAKPARMLPFQDSDGKLRFYPQALLKQLNGQNQAQFGPNDITAVFNSEMNYWFEGDPLPMSAKQVDMQYVVLHELIHGLGFTNSWNDYANIQALTPVVGDSSESGSSQPEFIEFAFDKHLILLPSGTSLTPITDQLNQFKSTATNEGQFFSSFATSPQFPIAQSMFNNATTHGTMGFLLTPNLQNKPLSQDQIAKNVVVLETSLNPYVVGSSIGHVDLQTYINSPDFLMMYTYPPGKTLDDMMSRAGSTTSTGPIGPQLRSLLGSLGYDVKQSYTPPTPGSGGSSSNGNSSFINFNIILSLICIFLTLINNFYF